MKSYLRLGHDCVVHREKKEIAHLPTKLPYNLYNDFYDTRHKQREIIIIINYRRARGLRNVSIRA